MVRKEEEKVSEEPLAFKRCQHPKEIRAGRKTKRDKTVLKNVYSKENGQVQLTNSLITTRRRRNLLNIWLDARGNVEVNSFDRVGCGEATASRFNNGAVIAPGTVNIPNFKVGSLEIYRRFPLVYDYLMQHHDCSAIEMYLHEVLTVLQEKTLPTVTAGTLNVMDGFENGQKSKSVTIAVADFGCGTGRISCMLSRHSAVGALYCYDSEAAMLGPCIDNVVRSIAKSRLDVRDICIIPHGDCSLPTKRDECLYIGEESNGSEAATDAPRITTMKLCVRPYSFQNVQQGALKNHARCRLIVCAWSLSYVMRAHWGADRWHTVVDETINSLLQLLETTAVSLANEGNEVTEDSGSSALIIIETLGTNTTEPRRHNTLLERLETHHGFQRRWVRTDYNFREPTEAVQLTRFFFGETLAQRLSESGSTTLPECTGIWTRWRK
ncbi:hypothetical protein, conserved [Trypanosoma brucei brucei TREU927]|uniref:Methyltransferase domain-containing protein n=1 Tax=Trypanosoma brucei brucei (strain 927/4 GUTat10.1) TaxID=185431 RepID=Q385L0_TRYB2|nr:hypothetical protein, conserved [Trypanosoma brucei brucei TREU927]EAN79521.1 hypothetical protein, conserved [Trypanosoma brucei brucei TREU927]